MDDLAVRLGVNELIAAYVDCIDEDRLEEWPDFFVEQCRYVITSRASHEAGLPHGVVYAASPYGLYRTTDGGSSWRLVNTDSSFRVGVSAQNPDVIYSISFNGPLRSTDGGTTFESRGSGREYLRCDRRIGIRARAHPRD